MALLLVLCRIFCSAPSPTPLLATRIGVLLEQTVRQNEEADLFLPMLGTPALLVGYIKGEGEVGGSRLLPAGCCQRRRTRCDAKKRQELGAQEL